MCKDDESKMEKVLELRLQLSKFKLEYIKLRAEQLIAELPVDHADIIKGRQYYSEGLKAINDLIKHYSS